MARKYKRDSRGRFAGGAGQNNGRSSNSGKRVTPKNGSVAMKAQNSSKPRASTGGKMRNGLKAAGKFARKNPRLVLAGAYGVASVSGHISAKRNGKKSPFEDFYQGMKYAESVVANKRGIGGKPGAGLKVAKRGRISRAHKIRS